MLELRKLSTQNLLWVRTTFYALGHIALFYLLWQFDLFLLFLTLCVFAFGGFAVSAYAHRTLAHKTVVWKNRFIEWILILGCVGSGIGSPLGWAAVHRMHHAYLDTDKDPHSPWRIGFWRSYFHLWDVKPEDVPTKFLTGLTRYKQLFWVHQNAIWLLIAFHTLPFVIFGIDWTLVTLAASCLGVHAMGFTNAVNHWAGEPKKIRTTPTWWLQFGENCHEFHHKYPRSYSFGTGIYDISARVLETFKFWGIVDLQENKNYTDNKE